METPPSAHFTTVDLAGLFNASTKDLPESLPTPQAVAARQGRQTFRGMPFDLGPEDGPNVILLDEQPLDVPLDGTCATYVVVLHVVEDRRTRYAEGLADFQLDGNELGDHVSSGRLDDGAATGREQNPADHRSTGGPDPETAADAHGHRRTHA